MDESCSDQNKQLQVITCKSREKKDASFEEPELVPLSFFSSLTYFIVLTFLLAYISCYQGVHCDISMYTYNVPCLDSPPS
jgi:hypothetical protein